MVVLGMASISSTETLYEIIDLGTLGEDTSSASSINNNGQIVGRTSNSPLNQYRAVLFDPTGAGNNIDLDPFGETSSASSINDNGQIMGFSTFGRQRATLFDSTGGGNNIDLGTLGGSLSMAFAINDD